MSTLMGPREASAFTPLHRRAARRGEETQCPKSPTGTGLSVGLNWACESCHPGTLGHSAPSLLPRLEEEISSSRQTPLPMPPWSQGRVGQVEIP